MRLKVASAIVSSILACQVSAFAADRSNEFVKLMSSNGMDVYAFLHKGNRIEEKFVFATERIVGFNLDKAQVMSDMLFAIDCSDGVKRVALIETTINSSIEITGIDWKIAGAINFPKKFDIHDLHFEDLKKAYSQMSGQESIPSSLELVAEYACKASISRPPQAQLIARKILETGNASDLKTLMCEITFDEDKHKITYEISFSDEKKFVRLQGLWEVRSRLTANKIVISQSEGRKRDVISVNRKTGELTIEVDGSITAEGQCVASSASAN